MQPVPGHPHVSYQYSQTPWGTMQIDCFCRVCGDQWRHECSYPQKAPVWVAKYAARHAHGNVAVQRRFTEQYHQGLQALRRM
jgi:hypothetical protein